MSTDRATRDQRALYAVAGQFFVNGVLTASFVARAPQIRDQLGVTVDTFGLLLTLATSVGLLGSAVAGRVVHTATTRRVLQVGAVLAIATLPVIGVARSPMVWLAAMMTYAFVDVFVDISMNLQGSWISARRHAPVINRLHGLWSLGTLAGGLGAVAANAVGLSPFAHLSLVAAATAVLLVVITRNLLRDDQEAHGGAARTAAPATGSRGRTLALVLLALAGMFAAVAEAVPADWATFRLTDDLDAPAAVGSAAFASLTVGMTLLRFGGDWLQVRLGRHGLRRLAIGLAGTGIVLATLVDVTAAALVGFAVVGLGVATFMPTLYDDAARHPGRRGAALGAMTAGMRVAYLGSPVAVGTIAGTSRSVGDAVALLTLPALVGLFVISEWNERSRRRQAATATAREST